MPDDGDVSSGVKSREAFPLYERFPALRTLPRVRLCNLPSPIVAAGIPGAGDVWIKRDDLNSPVCGGNKARSLEFLLGAIAPGSTIVTVGGAGSTHVLATMLHASAAGLEVESHRWMHDMNPAADVIAERLNLMAGNLPGRNAAATMLRAWYRGTRPGRAFVPIGGSSALGVLGHVNAGLEIAAQVAAGEMPVPHEVVVPVGSGGTAAGLLVGLSIAGMRTKVVGARVGPRVFVNRGAVLRLAARTRRLIEKVAAMHLPRLDRSRLEIVHNAYGGAYGRPLSRAVNAAELLQSATGIELDDTYSAKAWTVALDRARLRKEPLLFLLTFDSRCLTS